MLLFPNNVFHLLVPIYTVIMSISTVLYWWRALISGTHDPWYYKEYIGTGFESVTSLNIVSTLLCVRCVRRCRGAYFWLLMFSLLHVCTPVQFTHCTYRYGMCLLLLLWVNCIHNILNKTESSNINISAGNFRVYNGSVVKSLACFLETVCLCCGSIAQSFRVF